MRTSYVAVAAALVAIGSISGNASADGSTTTSTTVAAAAPVSSSTTSTTPPVTSSSTASTIGAVDVPKLPHKSGTGRRVVYSNKSGQVWVVNAAEQVIRTFLVSGQRGVPSPGSYRVFSQSASSYSLELPGATFRYMTRFAFGPHGGNVGFHEIPLRFGRPMQTVEQLGQFLSDGCLRSATADAFFIFNWAKAGTPVIVVL